MSRSSEKHHYDRSLIYVRSEKAYTYLHRKRRNASHREVIEYAGPNYESGILGGPVRHRLGAWEAKTLANL